MNGFLKLSFFITFSISTIVYATPNDNIGSDLTYNMSVHTGENNLKNIPVIVKLDGNNQKPLSKKYIKDVSVNAFDKAKKLNLKNPYSFKPREVVVEQVLDTIEIIAKYTAENSYGADVASEIRVVKFLGTDGNYYDKPQK